MAEVMAEVMEEVVEKPLLLLLLLLLQSITMIRSLHLHLSHYTTTTISLLIWHNS
jgi:hypothetical protein